MTQVNPTIRGPFIDKFAMTIPFSPDEVEGLVSILRDCASDHLDESYRVELVRQRQPSLYSWNFNVYPGISNDTFLRVSAIHQDEAKNPVRMEFNPEGISQEHTRVLHDFFGLLFNDATTTSLRDTCLITRADIALDIIGLRLDEVIVTYPGKQKGNIWTGRNGEIETIYCGSRSSKHFVRAYRKPLPTPNRGEGNTRRRVRVRPRIRCEAEWQPYRRVDELYDAGNALRGLQVSYIRNLLDSTRLPRHQLYHFVDSYFRRGPQGAMALIDNEPDKRKYRSALRDSQIGQLDVQMGWDNWPDQLDRVLYILGPSI